MAKKQKGLMAIDKMPARLDLDATLLPDIKDWEVGKTYDIELKVKMVSQRQNDPYDGGEKEMSAGFTIVSAKTDSDADEPGEGTPEQAAADKINKANEKKRRGY